jgi:hypothetical protein
MARGLRSCPGATGHDVAIEAGFALLPIGDNVNTRFDLLTDYVCHRLVQQPGEMLMIIGLGPFLLSQQGDEGVGSCQATDVCGQDAMRTALHVFFSP